MAAVVFVEKGFAVVEIRIPISLEERQYKEDRLKLESVTTETKLFSGLSSHSSTPHLGDNAIQKMFDFLQKMPENIVLIEADAETATDSIEIEIPFSSIQKAKLTISEDLLKPKQQRKTSK